MTVNYIGPFLILKTKHSDVAVGGTICSDGCKPKGGLGYFCNNCGKTIIYDRTITANFQPSFRNFDVPYEFPDVFHMPDYINGYHNGYHNGEYCVSILIPSKVDDKFPLQTIDYDIIDLESIDMSMDVWKVFIDTYGSLIDWIREHTWTHELKAHYGSFEYQN